MSNTRPLQAADSRPPYRMAHFSSRGEFRVRSIGEAVAPSRPPPCGPLGSNLCCDDREDIPSGPSLGPSAEVSQSPTRGRQRENGGRQRRVRTHRSHHLATGAQELPARHRAIGCWPPTLGVGLHRRPSAGCCWIRGCFLVECPEQRTPLEVLLSLHLLPLFRSFRFVS